MTDTEKLTQIRDARRMADWIEKFYPTFGGAHFPSTEGLVRTLRSLASALEAKQADTERLDWLEMRSAAVSVFDPPSGDAWVWCVGAYSTEAAIAPGDVKRDIEGQGDTLREAIDSAMQGGVFPPSDSISVPGND